MKKTHSKQTVIDKHELFLLLKEFGATQKILIVEDDIKASKMINEFLQQAYSHIDCITDSTEALMQYEQTNYDIVITDLNMPELNGIELARRILQINPEQQIIIATGNHNPKHYHEAALLGITNYILKPIDSVLLLKVLYRVSKTIADVTSKDIYIAQLLKTNEELLDKQKEMQHIINTQKSTIENLEDDLHDAKSY